jgi:hypothetical protein
MSALGKALEAHARDTLKLAGKDQMRDIDAYEAETKRIGAMADMLPTDAEGMKQLIQQLVKEAMGTSLKPILDANKEGLKARPETRRPDRRLRRPRWLERMSRLIRGRGKPRMGTGTCKTRPGRGSI